MHVHTTHRAASFATYLAAWQARASAPSTVRGRTVGQDDEPAALSAIVAATAHTQCDTGLSLSAVCDLEPCWEALRKVYAPFESRATRADGPGVSPRDPGWAAQQSASSRPSRGLGSGSRRENAYAIADRVLNRLIKVTPSSKVVGDLALALVGAGRDGRRVRSRPAIQHPRQRDPVSCEANSVTPRAAGRNRCAPRLWRAGAEAEARAGNCPPRTGPRWPPGVKRQATLNRLLFPAPHGNSRRIATSTATRRGSAPISSSTAFAKAGAPRGIGTRRRTAHRARSDLRRRRRVACARCCASSTDAASVLVRDRSIASDVPAAEKEADKANPDHVAARSPVWSRSPCRRAMRSRPKQTIATIEAAEDGGRDHRTQRRHRRPCRRLRRQVEETLPPGERSVRQAGAKRPEIRLDPHHRPGRWGRQIAQSRQK